MSRVKVDGNVFHTSMNIYEMAFYHVSNMLTNSLKSLATDSVKANSSDMALVIGFLVPIYRVEGAVCDDTPKSSLFPNLKLTNLLSFATNVNV